MADMVTAYIVMAHAAIADIVMASIAMADVAMAYIVMAYRARSEDMHKKKGWRVHMQRKATRRTNERTKRTQGT